ncbi:MAG: flagellar motor switch protein FliG [Thermoleophilaceae bacterium]|nr:flagellar motor switch protein FliG [Thermoleophilaceae bacterium]
MSGMRKAATLLVSLGADRAAQVFKHLREHEIEALSLEMAKLRTVPPEEVEAVYTEVIETVRAARYCAEGGVEYAREVLEASVGRERAEEIIARLTAIIETRPFEFLRRTTPEQIYAFLANESPQTIALVVANLHTTLAAQVLAQMPPDVQAQVAMAIASMVETSPDVVKEVEGVIRQKVSAIVQQDYSTCGGVKGLAEILNAADRATERNVIETLAESDAELAEEVKMLLFVFEDIVKLDDRAVQLVLKEVDQKDLALALRGTSEEVKQKILQNMSQRGAEMLREEMEYQPPQRRSVVEEAQGRIVAAIRRLEEAGAIVIGRDGGDGDEQLL